MEELLTAHFWIAVGQIIMIDILLGGDNAVVSVPIIIWGSQMVLRLMDRFPIIITAGGMLLGWIAGTMAHTDPALRAWLPQTSGWNYGLGAAGALLVCVAGLVLRRRGQVAT